ncbi:MAG: cytochrome c [Candidatus Binatus sp.]|jgi:mono/diheme cytochrome c family protein|uniref:c-type cytochrome n=1 Tax=Candidatus Binatus sp. TaxID=2811406 RepID=UPI003CB5CA70
MTGRYNRVAIALPGRALTALAQASTGFLLLTLMLATSARSAAAQSGIRDYQNYCAECHGLTGKGDGPSRLTIPMNPPPNDLTQMARKNGGKFPFDEVVDSIDGRKNIPSHARLQMPFWGTTLQKPGQEFTPESDAEVKKRIEAMARFVESIQQK